MNQAKAIYTKSGNPELTGPSWIYSVLGNTKTPLLDFNRSFLDHKVNSIFFSRTNIIIFKPRKAANIISLNKGVSQNPLVSYLYYQNVYEKKSLAWNRIGLNSGYTPDEIKRDYLNTFYILGGMLGTGLGLSLIIWLIALIDGIYNMNKIDNLFNFSNKNSKLKLNFGINIESTTARLSISGL